MTSETDGVLPAGKLAPELLAEVLAAAVREDASVVEGPGIGRDVAIIDAGGPMLLAAKTDPITFATDEIGYYAVVVNSNDLATRGARARWMLVTLLLPEGGTTPELVRDVMRQLREACDRFNITMVGGHTEVTVGLDRPIVVGFMLGEVPRGLDLRPENVRPGDAVLMTKAAAVEGTAIIAREMREELLRRGFGEEFVDRCARMLHEPGISVLAEAQAAVEAGGVRTMHDPTEGGVATGLWELAVAADRRIVVDVAAIPVLDECREICASFGLDPLGLIASGSLLIVAERGRGEAIAEAVRSVGVQCVEIGRVEDGPGEAVDGASGKRLPRYDQDELTKLF